VSPCPATARPATPRFDGPDHPTTSTRPCSRTKPPVTSLTSSPVAKQDVLGEAGAGCAAYPLRGNQVASPDLAASRFFWTLERAKQAAGFPPPALGSLGMRGAPGALELNAQWSLDERCRPVRAAARGQTQDVGKPGSRECEPGGSRFYSSPWTTGAARESRLQGTSGGKTTKSSCLLTSGACLRNLTMSMEGPGSSGKRRALKASLIPREAAGNSGFGFLGPPIYSSDLGPDLSGARMRAAMLAGGSIPGFAWVG